MLRMSPAAQAMGAAKASTAQAIDTAQPPTPRLSTGTFTPVQPISVPETIAIKVTPSQRSSGGTTGCRLACTPATPTTRPANTMPPAACQAQKGWLETGAPQANLGARFTASNSPQ